MIIPFQSKPGLSTSRQNTPEAEAIHARNGTCEHIFVGPPRKKLLTLIIVENYINFDRQPFPPPRAHKTSDEPEGEPPRRYYPAGRGSPAF